VQDISQEKPVNLMGGCGPYRDEYVMDICTYGISTKHYTRTHRLPEQMWLDLPAGCKMEAKPQERKTRYCCFFFPKHL